MRQVKKFALLATVAGALLVPVASASAADSYTCQFNGVTGQPAESQSYPQSSVVRVVVTDANPFLYAYEIKANDQRVTEASIGDFFKFAFNINFPKAAAGAGGGAAAQSAQAGMAICTEDVAGAALVYVAEVSLAKAAHARIDSQFGSIERLSETAQRDLAVQSAVYLHPQKLAPEVRAAALAAVGVHDRFAASVRPIHGDLATTVPSWAQTVARLKEQSAEMGGAIGCSGVEESIGATVQMMADATRLQTNLAAAGKKLLDAETARQRLATTANDPNRFFHTHVLSRYDAPTDVTLVIRRKAITVDDTFHHVASQRINVGGRARFSFSAGLGWTELGNTTYGVAKRFVTPQAGGNDTVNAVVVIKENSNAQIFPMVTFNTRLTPSQWAVPANLQLVLGVGVSRADAKPLPGYLLGLGVDSFGQRLLMTGGLFFGEEHRLGGGLWPGDRIPASETTVPMQRRMVGKLGIGLTYRIF